MKNQNSDAGPELLSLLRQQRYLYHQLKILTDRQQELAGTDSPELLLEVISGRRKLTEKLLELNSKLRPIKSNWHRLSCQVGAKHKSDAQKTINQIGELASQISANTPPKTSENTKFQEDWRFDELFAGTQP